MEEAAHRLRRGDGAQPARAKREAARRPLARRALVRSRSFIVAVDSRYDRYRLGVRAAPRPSRQDRDGGLRARAGAREGSAACARSSACSRWSPRATRRRSASRSWRVRCSRWSLRRPNAWSLSPRSPRGAKALEIGKAQAVESPVKNLDPKRARGIRFRIGILSGAMGLGLGGFVSSAYRVQVEDGATWRETWRRSSGSGVCTSSPSAARSTTETVPHLPSA
jgi:hypothetical protein